MMAQQIVNYETYKRIKRLGAEDSDKVYLVECASDGTLCVIKRFDLSKMNGQEINDAMKEAKILEAFNHPNIVKFREVYKTKNNKLCIVMGYADGGDLLAKIKEQKVQPFPENQVLDWFTQICLAIKYVHDQKTIHRNLKAQNTLLTKDNIIKLGSFGTAKVLSHALEKAETKVRTSYYLAPEIINGQPYSFESDIWSLGVVLYELCALAPPFNARSLPLLAMKIGSEKYPPIPEQYSNELKNLIANLLQVDPSKRPSIDNILKNPLIKNRAAQQQHQQPQDKPKPAIQPVEDKLNQPQDNNKIASSYNAAEKPAVEEPSHNRPQFQENEQEEKKEAQHRPGPLELKAREREEMRKRMEQGIEDRKDKNDGVDSEEISDKEAQEEAKVPEFEQKSNGYSKLQVLQMKLENILGQDIFLKAYRVAKDLLQKHSFDEIEQKYGREEDGYAALFPFMSKESREHDLGFVFTYVICEEKAEQNDQ